VETRREAKIVFYSLTEAARVAVRGLIRGGAVG